MGTIIDVVQRFRKIEEVCSTKDDAPPVYLMDEVCELANSSPENASSVADSVVKKLANRNPVVKYKALRLTRHMCIKGATLFQKNMQRYSSTVRELVHFRGEPDAFKGDALNQRVRDAAKETVEVLFSSSSATSTLASKGRIQGFGGGADSRPASSSYSSSTSTSTSGSKYIGFGSQDYAAGKIPGAAPRPSNTSGSTFASDYRKNFGDYIAEVSAPEGYTTMPERTHLMYSSGASGGSAQSERASYQAPSSNLPSAVLGTEEQVVEQICAPGGLRPAPEQYDLQKFLEAASYLDGLRIAELLRSKMEGTSWQQALRSLCALEVILQKGSTETCQEVSIMFQTDLAPVKNLLRSPQATVKERAQKVLNLLEGKPDAPAPTPAPAAPSKPPPAVDLLGGLDDPVPSAAAAGHSDDLFGGLNLAADAAAAHHPPAAAQPRAAPAAAAPAPKPVVDPFSVMDSLDAPAVSAVPAAAASAAPAAAAAPATRPPLDDFFADIRLSGGGAAPAAAAGDNRLGSPTHAQHTGDVMGQGTPGMMPQQPGVMQQQHGMMPQQPGMMPQYGQPGMVPQYGQPGMVPQGMVMGPRPGMGMAPQGMMYAQPGMMPQYGQPGMMPPQMMQGGYAQGPGGPYMVYPGGMQPMPGYGMQPGMVPGMAAPYGMQPGMMPPAGGMSGASSGQVGGPAGSATKSANWAGTTPTSSKADPIFDFVKDELKTK